jgi:hypothetical protein
VHPAAYCALCTSKSPSTTVHNVWCETDFFVHCVMPFLCSETIMLCFRWLKVLNLWTCYEMIDICLGHKPIIWGCNWSDLVTPQIPNLLFFAFVSVFVLMASIEQLIVFCVCHETGKHCQKVHSVSSCFVLWYVCWLHRDVFKFCIKGCSQPYHYNIKLSFTNEMSSTQ